MEDDPHAPAIIQGLIPGQNYLSRMGWIRVKKEGHATPKDF
jgi:hypothetical protein